MAETQGLERSLTVGEQTYDPNNYDSTNDTRLHEDPAEIFKNLDLNSDGNLDVREVGIDTVNQCNQLASFQQ